MNARMAPLALLAASLAALLAAELRTATPAMPVIPAVTVAAPTTPDADRHGAAAQATALARPLFRPDRRPVKHAAPTHAGLPRLSGIMRGAGTRLAIFQGNAKPLVLGPGDRLGRYRIKQVGPGSVIIEANGRTLTLLPRFAGGDATPAPAGPLTRPPPGPADREDAGLTSGRIQK